MGMKGPLATNYRKLVLYVTFAMFTESFGRANFAVIWWFKRCFANHTLCARVSNIVIMFAWRCANESEIWIASYHGFCSIVGDIMLATAQLNFHKNCQANDQNVTKLQFATKRSWKKSGWCNNRTTPLDNEMDHKRKNHACRVNEIHYCSGTDYINGISCSANINYEAFWSEKKNSVSKIPFVENTLWRNYRQPNRRPCDSDRCNSVSTA